jgi:two-component system response regulator YesN
MWPSCKTIFLTGYDDFNYAKSALHNEGMDYILKTEDDEVIVESIKRALEKIKEEEKNQDIVCRAERQMELALPLLRRDFLHDLLEGNIGWSDEVRRQFDGLNTGMDMQCRALLLIGSIDQCHNLSMINKSAVIYKVKEIVQEYLGGRNKLTFTEFGCSRLVWLIQLCNPADVAISEAELDNIVMFVHENLYSIQNACRELTGVTLSFVLPNKACKWEDVHLKYKILCNMIDRNYSFQQERILTEKHVQQFQKDSCNENGQEIMSMLDKARNKEKMEVLLENGRLDDFFNLVDQISEIVIKTREFNDVLCAEVFYSISLFFISYMNKYGLSEAVKSEIDFEKLMCLVGKDPQCRTALDKKPAACRHHRNRRDVVQP